MATDPGHNSPVPDFREWALCEDVLVILTGQDADLGASEYLICRISGPGAVILTFYHEGFVYANGEFVDFGDDLMCYCGLVDAVMLSPEYPEIGTAVTTYGEKAEF